MSFPRSPAELGIGWLFEAVRDAVVVADARGRIIFWNRGAVEMFGWSQEEMVGEDVRTLVPEHLRPAHDAGMQRFRERGHGRLLDTGAVVELPGRRKGGRPLWVELSLASIDREEGRFAVAVLRDVTERVRLRQSLEEQTGSLTAANESLRAFSAVVSHDLKEPVRAVQAYLRVLQEDHGARLPPDALALVDQAQRAADRLQALLVSLLDLSRVDRAALVRQPVDVVDALASDACQAMWAGAALERDADVRAVGGGPALVAAPSVLVQALGNLVLNAIVHNPSPRPVVRVRTARAASGEVELWVEDNGPGLPPALESAFNAGDLAFLSSTGYGLLLARRAAERLGGELWAQRSADLGGAAMRLRLP